MKGMGQGNGSLGVKGTEGGGGLVPLEECPWRLLLTYKRGVVRVEGWRMKILALLKERGKKNVEETLKESYSEGGKLFRPRSEPLLGRFFECRYFFA